MCGGLGLGIVPFFCQNFCQVIDVVEVDDSLISLVKESKRLSSKVNIIEDDFITYEPKRKYDLIFVDLWTEESSNFEEQVELIQQKYVSYLNDRGTLYIPMLELIKIDQKDYV